MRAVRYAVGRSKEERPKNREVLNRIETFESALNLLSFHSALTVFLIYCGCAFAEEKLKRDKRIVKQQKKLYCHAHVSAPAPWDILRIIGLFVTWQQRSRISLCVCVCVRGRDRSSSEQPTTTTATDPPPTQPAPLYVPYQFNFQRTKEVIIG